MVDIVLQCYWDSSSNESDTNSLGLLGQLLQPPALSSASLVSASLCDFCRILPVQNPKRTSATRALLTTRDQ